MEIDPIRRASHTTPVTPVRASREEEELAASVAAVRALNKSEFLGSDRQLMFARDPDTQKPVIQIVDRNTGETIEQIPPKQLLRILADMAQGKKGDVNS